MLRASRCVSGGGVRAGKGVVGSAPDVVEQFEAQCAGCPLLEEVHDLGEEARANDLVAGVAHEREVEEEAEGQLRAQAGRGSGQRSRGALGTPRPRGRTTVSSSLGQGTNRAQACTTSLLSMARAFSWKMLSLRSIVSVCETGAGASASGTVGVTAGQARGNGSHDQAGSEAHQRNQVGRLPAQHLDALQDELLLHKALLHPEVLRRRRGPEPQGGRVTTRVRGRAARRLPPLTSARLRRTRRQTWRRRSWRFMMARNLCLSFSMVLSSML